MSFKFTLGSINKKFNEPSKSFRRRFDLKHFGDRIFKKIFDGSNSAKVLLSSNTITIPNHFFRTGERLDYYTFGQAIGIDHTSSGVGGATTLPQSVYAVKVSEDKISLAANFSNAQSGSVIGLTTVGVGETHILTADKTNTKAIIALDNIIQSPIVERVGAATTVDQVLNQVVSFHDIGGFNAGDLIKINNEILKIIVIGFNGVSNDALVEREWMGTTKQNHGAGDTIQLLVGDYNIIGDQLNFKESPFGGLKITVGVQSSSVNVSSNSFTSPEDNFETGTEVRLRSLNPPLPLSSNRNYFLIKNEINNFSFAEDKTNSLVGVAITLTTTGIGTHKLLFVDTSGSSFQGRVFTRSDYTGNILIDDISQNFTGIGKTFTLKSSGVNTTGITSDFGVILINNIFQKPEVDYEFIGGSATGITSISFTGNESNVIDLNDVNANKLPRKGLIVSLGNSEGFGYQKRETGVGTAVVSGFGTITVAMGFSGGGYTNPNTTYRLNIEKGSSTTGAAGTFTVANGFIQNIFINTPGVGYTFTDPPQVIFDDPVPYDDKILLSSSTGVGASVSVEIGFGLSITSYDLTKIGYGFTVGEELVLTGIPTVTSIGSSFKNAIFTVEKTADDIFNGWVLGKFQVLDDFSGQFDGSTKIFTLTEDGVPLSIEKEIGSLISLDDVLLVFINDVLQHPGKSYVFDGGTRIEFTEPPVAGSSLQVLFYRGTDNDMSTTSALQSIKKGDSVIVKKNRKQVTPVDQDARVIFGVQSRDTLRTNLYTKKGISAQTLPLRPVTWSRQQEDKFIEGNKVGKSRDLYASRVQPATQLIKSVGVGDVSYYTRGGSLAFTKTDSKESFGIRIVDDQKNNSGYGTTTTTNPVQIIKSVAVNGDEGTIIGIGTTAKGFQFNFYIPENSVLRQNPFGGITKSGISTGDYFLVSRSNIGGGVTSMINTGVSTLGVATDNLDTLYQVRHHDNVGSGQSVRVFVEVQSPHNLNTAGLGSGFNDNYGTFSWAKFTGSASGLAFTAHTFNGLVGLSTAPTIQRVEKLLLDYT